jgi:hypothetical protein
MMDKKMNWIVVVVSLFAGLTAGTVSSRLLPIRSVLAQNKPTPNSTNVYGPEQIKSVWPQGLLRTGGPQNTSKLAKYLRPAPVTSMDWAMLKAQVILLQEHMDWDHGTPAPLLSYDPQGDRIQAWVSVSEDFEKLSLDVMRKKIHNERAFCNGALLLGLPDLETDGFILKVVTARGKPLAECTQLDCVFH